MKKNRKGCYNEKIAICYLMAKGLDVFDSAFDSWSKVTGFNNL